ncbi:MAG: adenylate/guanylate cyclase domain-containing protein [Thermodesulfobacteriota bacterium]|nr:adenylate/guanylate cyclase domain-containing protein [Thermodesulfobacteriota bacterium]
MISLVKKITRSHFIFLSVPIILLGLFAYSIGVPFLDLMELKTIDARFKSRDNIEPRSDVVLAVIDEKSIATEGKWMWPRSKMADLVTRLSNAGVKVIAFDIGFLEPDDKIIVKVIDNIQTSLPHLNAEDKKLFHRLKTQADNDKLLADAIKNSSAKIVLGYFFQLDEKASTHIKAEDLKTHQQNIINSRYQFERYSSKEAKNVTLVEPVYPQSNIKEISAAAGLSGYFNMSPDDDGVIRWLHTVLKFKDTLYAPLSLVTVSAFVDRPLSVNIDEYGVQSIQIGNLSIPTDELGRVLINYRGEEKSFPHISITDILSGNVPHNKLKNKIVLIGATAMGIYDLRVTPFGSVFPGIEIHANVADSILAEDFLHKPKWSAIFDVLAILVAGIFLGIVLPRVEVILGVIVGFVVFMGYILFCQYLFSKHGIVLNLVYPLSVILLIYVSITAFRYFMETKKKRFIKNAFSTYLAPAVVNQLIESPGNLELGGEDRDITAFFSDVQGFTSISEALTPNELVELLNEFLTEMTDIILKHEGTVDKFEGDAIIAFFGAPNVLKNHAERACSACIKMQQRLANLRENWKGKGKPQLKMRIGLCTGSAVVGNMGSENRMDYTMMGDTVNTAARLEGINKIYNIYTLISKTTCQAAGNGIATREIDTINVVGKSEPVTIYELLGFTSDVDDVANRVNEQYITGLQAYRNQDWDKAIKFFNAVLKISPDDGPSKAMIDRSNMFKSNPPGKNWNGSYSVTTK